MEQMQQRLKDTSDACIKALAGWIASKQSINSREDLLEAVHELRKVAARLEIEMAVSERAEMSHRPMPIPAHRSQVRRPMPQHQQTSPQAAPAMRGNNNDEIGNELPDFIAQGGNDDGQNAPRAPSAAPRSSFRRPVRRPQGGSEE